MCTRSSLHVPSIHLLPQTVDFKEKARYARWKAADIAKAFREGRVPQAGPPNGATLSIGDRPISPPSDFDDLSLSSSAIGIPPSIPPENPSPRRMLEHRLPPTGLPAKTPVRHAGLPDGTWSNMATPGLETPASPSPFSLAAVLNASQRDGSPKPKFGLNKVEKVAAPSQLKGHGEDMDLEEGDDCWSTAGNAFSRQNSVTLAGATPPDSASAGASFATNLTSLSEGMCHLVTTCTFVFKFVSRTLFSTIWCSIYKTSECPQRSSSYFCCFVPQRSTCGHPSIKTTRRAIEASSIHPRY